MKKLLLLKLSLLVLGFAAYFQVSAQSNAEIMGARLLVDTPTTINHVVRFTYSYGIGTDKWGDPLTNPVIHQEVVKAVDSLGCTPLTGTYTGKWVLILRGSCEFGAKALAAQTAGATGVIIWNHTANAPLVNMAPGGSGASVTIPVLFVSHEDGREMTSVLGGGSQLFVSLSLWGFGKNNDLGFVNNSGALMHAGAIPKYQFDGSDIPAYRGYTGAFVGNTGTMDQTNVKLKSTVSFTPQGGSASVVYSDSVTVDTFVTSDSIIQVFSNKEYALNPSGVGRYDVSYEVSSDSTDATPSDNTLAFSTEVTNNVFCKGRFNAATQRPVINAQYGGQSGGTPIITTWGPMFYVKKGGHTLEAAAFSITDRDTNVKSLYTSLQKYVDFYCFKWKDGTGGPADNYIQAGELTLVSAAVKEFQEADSNNGKMFFSATWGDETGKPKSITLEDDSWYWFPANLSDIFLIGGDALPNFYNRANAAKNFGTYKKTEYWAPRYGSYADDLKGNVTDTVLGIPFGIADAYNSGIIDSAVYTSVDGLPNIAVYTSVFPTAVKNVATVDNALKVYPNPATDKVTLSYKLTEKAKLAHIKIIDAFGRNVYKQDMTDVQEGEVSVNTKGFASGNYYFMVISGEKAFTKAFTVVGK